MSSLPSSDKHHVNFFKPATGHARANSRLVTITVIVWALAVFGFQGLLVVMNRPTAEDQLAVFQAAWANVEAGQTLNAEQQRDVARVCLSVLGKNIALSGTDRDTLREALSVTVHGLLPAEQRGLIEGLAEGEVSEDLVAAATAAIGLESSGFDLLRANLLPSSLVAVAPGGLSEETRAALPGIMELYLTHNRSALTDFRFLGFPFHYWYTAQFLLIMFVLMCWIYCVLIDRIHRRHQFLED
jgi:putative solute:sodium symporter small subunit